jgi:Flp pilus assembly protein TadB
MPPAAWSVQQRRDMKTRLWLLALLALALWAFGLMKPQWVFPAIQIALAVATMMFLIHVVRRRRQKRAAAGGRPHAP